MLKNEETFKEFIDACYESSFIAAISRKLRIEKSTLFRWIAASERRPDLYAFEYGDHGALPLHKHIEIARKLGKIGRTYFDSEPDPIEQDDIPARVQRAIGDIKRGPTFTLRTTDDKYHRRLALETVGLKTTGEELDVISDEEIVRAIEDQEGVPENDPLFSDIPATDLEKLQAMPDPPPPTGRAGRVHVTTQEWAEEERRPTRPMPEARPGSESFEQDQAETRAAAEAASQPSTERQKAAAEARAKIERRVASGGPAMTALERELLSKLESPPPQSAPRGTMVKSAARPLPSSYASRSSAGDPPEYTGRGKPADGGVKVA